MLSQQWLKLSRGPRAARRFAFALSALAAFGWAYSASAAVIVNDTWRDGDDSYPPAPGYSETGFDGDADGDVESAWFQGGDGTLDPVGAGGPLRGQFSAPTSGSSASWTSYFTAEGNEVNLANPGDFVKVTWVFTPTNINNGGSNTSQNFRMALVDTPAAARLAANGAPGSAAYTGYGIFANMSSTLGNNNPFRLMERAGASGALLSASGDWAPLANGATAGNTGYVSGTQYTFEMNIARTALGELQVDTSITGGSLDNDGTASVSFLDASPNNGSFKFDTFSLRPSGATTTAEIFDTSLFQVESNAIVVVPEPASLVLLGIGGVALTIWRRQR